MSKILVVTNDFPPRRGGIESFVFQLCAGLPADGLVVYTARMDHSADVDAAVDYLVIRDRSRVLLPTPRVSRAVARVAREQGCDRVVFGAAAPLGLLARGLRAAGVRRVVALTHGHEVWWARIPVARALLRRIGDDADVLTYVSDYCRREIAAALSPAAASTMVRLSPGVDTGRFRPDIDGSDVRRRMSIPNDATVVLAASRLVPRKGQDTLISAWPAIRGDCPEAVLLVVGDGRYGAYLRALARMRRLGTSVRFMAGVAWEEMPSVYAAADVFALPCRTRLLGLEPEAFGIVFLEAAAAGLPVIAGDSGGAPETVRDGVTGHVLEGRDKRRLVELVTAALHLAPDADLGQLGRERVIRDFSVSMATEQLVALLESGPSG